MRFNEVSEAKRRKFEKIPARDFPLNRCYTPRTERSGVRVQRGRATKGSEEVAGEGGLF